MFRKGDLVIKNGVDLIEIERVAKSAENPAFVKRVFGTHELAEFETRGNRSEHLAGAFAAKEAFSKAIGTGIRGFRLSEVEILHNRLGAPYFLLSGEALALAEAQNLDFSLSITHTKTHAAAMVTAFTKGL